MKTKSILCILFLFVICFTQLSAQKIDVDIAKRILYDNYIFEGTVIRSDPYWTLDQKYIYTSSTIQISKILKGTNLNLDCGTVEVITEGGVIGDDALLISHNLVLQEGMHGIFLCNSTLKELPQTDYYPENNTVVLDVPYGEEGFIPIVQDGVNYRVYDWQFNFDDVQQAYDYLQITFGLTVEECKDGIRNTNSNYLDSLIQNDLQNLNSERHHSPTEVNSAAGTISYEMINRHISATMPQTFEFDIAFSGSSNSVYFGLAQFDLVYDTLTFKPHLSADTFTFVYSTGILTNKPYDVSINDFAYNTIRVFTQFQFPMPAGDSLFKLPNVPQTAIHVILPIRNCNNISDITMPEMSLAFTGYVDTVIPTQFAVNGYDSIYYSQPLQFPGCGTLHIDNITHFLNGGVNDVMRIEGANFGSTRGTSGKIFVRNADTKLSHIEIDSTDYLTGIWSDSLITFEMPGNIAHSSSGQNGVAGSGTIVLYNNSLDSIVSDSITVGYSITTQFSNLLQKKKIHCLMDDITPYSGGYLFKTDTSLSNSLHPDRWNCIDVGIKQWNCLSTVNFKLGGDTIVRGAIQITRDSINLISFGNTNSLSAVAQSQQWISSCSGHFAVVEVDIVVEKRLIDSLVYSTNCTEDIPAYKYDFYEAILHELGHCHSLNHVNNNLQVMYYGTRPVNIINYSSNRNIYLKADISARDGANYVIQHSPDSSFSFCGIGSIVPLNHTTGFCDSLPGGRMASTANCYSGIHEFQNEISDLEVYPNPTSNKLTLEFNNENAHFGLISISNYIGQTVFQEKENLTSGKNKLTLDVSELSSGLYFISMKSKDYNIYFKFVKQ